MSNSIAIVLPTYNNLDSLKRCLSSLQTQTVSTFNVYVCVDGSTDGTTEFLQLATYDFKLNVLVHSENKNKGRQATRNLAIKKSNESYILFLDSDFEVTPNWVEEHLEGLKNSPITIGRVYFTNSENPWADYYNSRGNNTILNPKEFSSRYYISANVGFKREVFDKVGLMDESIKVYGGDAEFALRLIHFGFNTVSYLPNALSVGVEHKTVKQAIAQYEQFSRHLLHQLIKQYPKNQDYFNYSKLSYFKILKWVDIDYFAEILENEKSGIFTRLGIRIALTIALIKEMR